MSEPSKPYYVTTPIYYVNARPHIGHAYTTIVADVLARRHRLLGAEVFFLTGTDEHGQKIERSAAKAGIAPQQFADEVSASFRSLWDRMGITYTDYIRTTDKHHALGVQQLFRTLWQKGFIYLDSYTGAYCVSDEAFVDVPVGEPCPDCGTKTEQVTEENFFFKLSAFQQKLLALIESGELKIENEARRNEVLSFVRGGLKDLSISRSSFTWGIPVPEDVQRAAGATQKHIVYVWLDALANYITAIGYPDREEEFAKWWPADLHLVGKEIIRFHCVYWPAFLMAAELPLPKAITAHGWLLFDNDKMSKSKGNIVRTETILDAFGDHVYAKQFPESTKAERDLFASDVLRYFLLREIPFGQDGSFSFDALITRYNADLVNGYGNLVSRVLNLIVTNFDSVVPDPPKAILVVATHSAATEFDSENIFTGPDTEGILATMQHSSSFYPAQLDGLSFHTFCGETSLRIGLLDGYFSFHKPWVLAKSGDETSRDKLREILHTAAESIRIITALLYPILPFATARVWQQLGLGDIEEAARNGELNNLQWGGLKPGTKLGTLGPIFPRADKGLAQIMADMELEKTNAQQATTQTDRPAAPLKAALTPAVAAPVTADSSDPAAAPRAFQSPSENLPVAGSTATTTGPDGTPSHTQAHASGVFAKAAAVAVPPAASGDQASTITIDDFAKVELRIAEVLVCERIPKADKLLRLEVSLGGEEKRQILSGIAEWYTPEELVGRRILVITNLAPRKMRGLESHGMLLAASEEGGKPFLATVPEGVPVGTRLK
jgi:methionyl-tRNA synthetase